MPGGDVGRLDPRAERQLVAELAAVVLGRAASEELAVFDETAEEYFADPRAVLAATRRDEPLGFGLDVAMLTPYVLAIVTPVVSFLAAAVADSVKAEGKQVVEAMVRRLFRGGARLPTVDSAAVSALSVDQARQIRTIAYERARLLGMPEDQCILLADSIVGGVLVLE